MAGTITYDIEGSRISYGVSGDQWGRRYTIDGLEAGVDPNNANVPALIDEAYDLLPNTGASAPPEIPNMFVRDVSVDRIWCTDDNPVTPKWSADGVITYTTPTSLGGGIAGSIPNNNGPGVTLATSSGVTEIDVHYERDGTTQLVTTNDNVTQAHRGVGFGISSTHTFTRLETDYPRARIDGYVGKLNAGLWNGYAAETVLCSAIDVRTDDAANHVVTYTFEVRPNWQQVFIHDDPFFPGNPIPLSVADPGALLVADVINTADFSLLNITLP